MRKSRSKIIAAGAGVVLAGGALASCGGDSVSADEYVGTVCTAIGDYVESVQGGQQAVIAAAAGDLSPEEGKAQITSFIGDAAAATDEAATQIADAGTPDVENGEEAADAITAAFNGLSDAFAEAQSQAEALPTDSEESFQSGAEELSTNLQESSTAIGEGLNSVQENPELTDAAENNTECQSIQDAPTVGATGATGP